MTWKQDQAREEACCMGVLVQSWLRSCSGGRVSEDYSGGGGGGGHILLAFEGCLGGFPRLLQ